MILGPAELADESAEAHMLERLSREINAGLHRQYEPGKKEYTLTITEKIPQEVRSAISQRCRNAGWSKTEWVAVNGHAVLSDLIGHWKLLLKAK